MSNKKYSWRKVVLFYLLAFIFLLTGFVLWERKESFMSIACFVITGLFIYLSVFNAGKTASTKNKQMLEEEKLVRNFWMNINFTTTPEHSR